MSSRRNLPQRYRGVALISVMLVVVILLAVVSRLLIGHNLTINQNQNVYAGNQALQYVLGAETLAREALLLDFENGGAEVDHLEELWAQDVLPFELDEGGYVEAQVRDRHGCFNLNSVHGEGGKENLERMKRLLRNLNMLPTFADVWKDWIDEDEVISGAGAEDSEYLVSEIPHRTPNTLVTDTSELALLKNMTAEELERLLPEVCLLPVAETSINVNTAGLHTLAALGKDSQPGALEALIGNSRTYTSVDDFLQEFPDMTESRDALSVVSEYFEVHAIAQVGDSSATLQSLLHRDPSTGRVTVLSRNFGKLFRSKIVVEEEDA